MILENQLTCIGSLLKPHGIKGEIVADLDFEVDLATLKCIVLDIDGIFVPFFLNSVRSRSTHSSLISIDGVVNEMEAKSLCGKDLFALSADLDETVLEDAESGFYFYDLIGYRLLTAEDYVVGDIIDCDDTTDNLLLIVRPEGGEGERVMVPFAEEFITGIDDRNKTISMDLPTGLLDLNKK